MEPIDSPDLTNENPAYWEQVLASHGLSAKRGQHPNKVALVGNPKVVEFLSTDREQKFAELGGNSTGFDVRKVAPEGSGSQGD